MSEAADAGSPLLLLVEEWRGLFARSIASRNPDFTTTGINLAVQCIIDRLLFLWICEGRGFEPARCIAAIGEAKSPDTALFALFHDAAKRYGGVFAGEGQDDPLRGITIDGSSVRAAVRRLDSADLPASGSISPEEVGAALERFLGSKIRLVDGKAIIGLRYDVERAGGVQVVPRPAIEHVISDTLVPLVAGEDGSGAAECTVLDPACGAGLFLLAAFRHLCQCFTARSAFGCLYGLDSDPAAAEAARLVLALALLDTGSDATLPLPELGQVRSGNALIGPDFYEDVRTKSYDHERRERINAFSWEAGFPQVLQRGGFDAVIGAPPPLRPSPGRVEREYLERHYAVYHAGGALPPYFIERGFSLLRPGGRLGYAIAGDWLRSKHGRSLRRWLQTYQIEEIVAYATARADDSGAPAPMPLSLLIAEKSSPLRPFLGARFPRAEETDLPRMLAIRGHPIDQAELGEGGWTLEDKRARELAFRLAARGSTLAEYLMSRIRRGTPVPPDCIIDGSLRVRLLSVDRRLAAITRPLVSAGTIGRYGLREPSGRYVIGIPTDERMDDYLSLVAEAAERMGGGPLPAMWQNVDESGEAGDASRILMPAKAPYLAAALDPDGAAAIDDSVIVVPSGSLYLMGLLNSRLFAFLIGELSPAGRPIAIRALERLPIVTLDPDLPEESALYRRFVDLVEKRVSLGEDAGEVCPASGAAANIERQIDVVVYDIYGLSETERNLVDRSIEGLMQTTKGCYANRGQ